MLLISVFDLRRSTDLEGKIALRNIARYHYHYHGKYLCNDRIDMEYFHQYFQQDVIQRQVEQANRKIAEKLLSYRNIRVAEYHEFHQQEAKENIEDKRKE